MKTVIEATGRESRHLICEPNTVLWSQQALDFAPRQLIISDSARSIFATRPPFLDRTEVPFNRKGIIQVGIPLVMRVSYPLETPKFFNYSSHSSVYVHHDFIHLCVPELIVQARHCSSTFSMRYRPVRLCMRLLVPQLLDLPFLKFFLMPL